MPEFDPTSEKQLIEAIKIAASQALAEEQWILCATLCRTIEELMIKNVVAGGAERAFESLKQTTVAVPLIGRTRPETPRPEPFAYANCARCDLSLEALGWHQPMVDVSTSADMVAGQPKLVRSAVEWTDWRHTPGPAAHEPRPVSVRPTVTGWAIINA